MKHTFKHFVALVLSCAVVLTGMPTVAWADSYVTAGAGSTQQPAACADCGAQLAAVEEETLHTTECAFNKDNTPPPPDTGAVPSTGASAECTCQAQEGAPHSEGCPCDTQPQEETPPAEGEGGSDAQFPQEGGEANGGAETPGEETKPGQGEEEGDPTVELTPILPPTNEETGLPLTELTPAVPATPACTCGATEGEPHGEECPLYTPSTISELNFMIDTDTIWDTPVTLTEDLVVRPGATLTIKDQLTITGDVTISGGGIIRSDVEIKGTTIGSEVYQNMLLVTQEATLTLQNITIDGGALWGNSDSDESTILGHDLTNAGLKRSGKRAAMVQVLEGGTLHIKDGTVLQNNDAPATAGAAIRADQSETYIYEGAYIQNHCASSGAVAQIGGKLTMYGGLIQGNIAADSQGQGGGGLRIQSDFELRGGKIRNNISRGNGGGIAITWTTANNTVSITNAEVSHNLAAINGGGIYGTYGVTVTVKHITLTENTAVSGGGICTDNATVFMDDVQVIKNHANRGGGVSGGRYTFTNCTITENSAYVAPAIHLMGNKGTYGGKGTTFGGEINVWGNTLLSGGEGGSEYKGDGEVLLSSDGVVLSAPLTGTGIPNIDLWSVDDVAADTIFLSGVGSYTPTDADLSKISFAQRFYKEDGSGREYGIYMDNGVAKRYEQVTVTFYPNYAGTTSVHTQKLPVNRVTALTINPFIHENYIFAGWNTQADGSGTSYADGAEVSFTEDTTLYAQWALPIAEVNGVQYPTLEAAVAAAGENAVLSLVNDVTLTSSLVIPEEKSLTLDLNDHYIKVPKASNGQKSPYAITNYGTLTITDNSEAGNGSIAARGVSNEKGATMTFAGGTIESWDSDGGGAAIYNEGTLTVTGGTLKFTGQETQDRNAGMPLNALSGSTTTITGGRFESPYTALYLGGKATISNIQLDRNSVSFWQTIKLVGKAADVTLNDVTIIPTRGGALEVSGGKAELYNCNFKQSGVADWNSTCVAVSNGGTVDVYSGTYTAEGYGAYVFNSGGTINIHGGDFKADKAVLQANNNVKDDDGSIVPDASKLLVSGGTFKGVLSVDQNSKLEISGGYYSAKESANYLADGLDFQLMSVSDSEYFYSYYSSPEEAAANSEPGDIITDFNHPPVENAPEHTVTLVYGNGDPDFSKEYQENAIVPLPTPTRTGYDFVGWFDEAGNNFDAYYTVGSTDATLTAHWTAVSTGGSYTDDDDDDDDRDPWENVYDKISRADRGDTIEVSGSRMVNVPRRLLNKLAEKGLTLRIRRGGRLYVIHGDELGALTEPWYDFDDLGSLCNEAESSELPKPNPNMGC